MTLRKHQQQIENLSQRIANHEVGPRSIIASVTPGGGKSMLPRILADELIPAVADYICWVVPRNSLKEQGEADFCASGPGEIRAAENGRDMRRGTLGYITTYQAIAADPQLHYAEQQTGRWIVFLDEPHHVVKDGQWASALDRLINRAALVVYASGTLGRSDGQPIAWVSRLLSDGIPGADYHLVEYTRSDAIAEGATVPIRFETVDGEAQWESEGEGGTAVISEATEDRQAAVFTALRTDYARELLEACIADWEHTREAMPDARLLVVAPDIATARRYHAWLGDRFAVGIATSADTARAAQRIRQFKGLEAPRLDVLVTVAMAYEGMSVPPVTHIACLTHIRSVPWLEQCFARANRRYPGKTEGVVYGPADTVFLEAIRRIEAEERLAVASRDPEEEARESGESNDNGQGRPLVTPIGSRAHIDLQRALEREKEYQQQELTPSQAEAVLRRQIHRHVRHVVDSRRPGSRASMERVIRARIAEVCPKPRAEMSREELKTVWMMLRERWPV